MRDDTLGTVMNVLEGMPSSSPWSDATGRVYVMAMNGWSDDLAIQAITYCALNLLWRPSPAEVRSVAARIYVDRESPIPSPMVAISEIRRIINRYEPALRLNVSKNPFLDGLVDELAGDWIALGKMQSDDFEKGFAAAYDRTVKNFYEQIATSALCLTESMESTPKIGSKL